MGKEKIHRRKAVNEELKWSDEILTVEYRRLVFWGDSVN